MNNRMPPLAEHEWNDAQRELAQEIINGPRGALLPPFEPLLRSPELMAHAQRLGEYLRYRSAIGTRLSELAILVTARHWGQPVEWAIHAPLAAQQGIAQSAIDDINHNREPEDLQDDERLVWRFCRELHQTRRVSDETWQQAVAAFDEKGVMDLVGLNGYYAFLSMVMNAAQTPAPPSPARLLSEDAL